MKGAFTGAVQNKAGPVRGGAGGHRLPRRDRASSALQLQVKLLRVIQERVFRRVGGTSDVRFDARIVAATNRQLADEVREGRFREDLYYRLNVIEIPLPPLRERRDDIPLLVEHFVEKYGRELGKSGRGAWTREALARLQALRLPRQRARARERDRARGGAVPRRRASTSSCCRRRWSSGAARRARHDRPRAERVANLDELVSAYERGLLLEALEQAGGVKKRAAAAPRHLVPLVPLPAGEARPRRRRRRRLTERCAGRLAPPPASRVELPKLRSASPRCAARLRRALSIPCSLSL